jgi:hypothetical protein
MPPFPLRIRKGAREEAPEFYLFYRLLLIIKFNDAVVAGIRHVNNTI